MAGIDAPLSNCKVYIYPGDHNPPHFHLRGPNSRASVDIMSLEVIAGKASKKGLGRSQRVGRKARKSGRIGIRVEKAQ
jgi:hypothetical protein